MEARVERELVLKCQSGGARFFEPLVRAYEADAVRIACAMVGDADAARDAVQEAFVKAYRAIGTFDSRRNFRPWFLQILRNQCRDLLRSRNARKRFEVPVDKVDARALSTDGERVHVRREAAEILWKGLAAIDPGQREIIVMKELQGLSYEEIAATMDIPEGTVASRLFHARRALRQALEEMGVRYP